MYAQRCIKIGTRAWASYCPQRAEIKIYTIIYSSIAKTVCQKIAEEIIDALLGVNFKPPFFALHCKQDPIYVFAEMNIILQR